uniref:Putative secreted protein n=1 Tax=Amblyomma cajennense TaxID=34607 RepID=A0A023FBI7_AMBCJ
MACVFLLHCCDASSPLLWHLLLLRRLYIAAAMFCLRARRAPLCLIEGNFSVFGVCVRMLHASRQVCTTKASGSFIKEHIYLSWNCVSELRASH